MPSLLRSVRRALAGAIFCYCLAAFALGAAWLIRPQATWWLALGNLFAPLLFAPLLLLLPLALLLRAWATAAVGLAAAVVGLALFGGQLLPPALAVPQGQSLRVMTFNHLFANARVDAIVAQIRAQDADIVALQELSNATAEALARDLRDEYPYQYLRPFDSPQGMGLISRLPFESSQEIWDGVRGQQVAVRVGGQLVTVMNIHLGAPHIQGRRVGGLPVVTGYDTGSTDRQVARLVGLVDQVGGPLVALGDFNTSDREPRYRELAARLHDAFRETSWGFGFTFPDHKRFGPLTVPLPLLRIDYVWSKNGVLPAAARVECNSTGADHCFLVADLRVAEP